MNNEQLALLEKIYSKLSKSRSRLDSIEASQALLDLITEEKQRRAYLKESLSKRLKQRKAERKVIDEDEEFKRKKALLEKKKEMACGLHG